MVLTRAEYLKNPEKWKGTDEEMELVSDCLDYVTNCPRFSQEFSPTITDINNIRYPNERAKRSDQFFIILSKKVLEVYNDSRKKRRGKRN